MGVSTVIAYGIPLTEEFGERLDGTDDVVDLIEDGNLGAKWVAWCPSAEGNQYVLGIELAYVSKNTDFEKLHAEWEQALATAPEEVREWAEQYDPDVHVMSGKN